MHQGQQFYLVFEEIQKVIICAANPNMKATRIVTIVFTDSVSRVKAKSVNTIIVNEGGTKSVEIILASLSVLFCNYLSSLE